jgi:hypothetical protein
MWNMMVSLLHWNVAEYEPYITTWLITANDLSAVRPQQRDARFTVVETPRKGDPGQPTVRNRGNVG